MKRFRSAKNLESPRRADGVCTLLSGMGLKLKCFRHGTSGPLTKPRDSHRPRTSAASAHQGWDTGNATITRNNNKEWSGPS